MTAEPAPPKPPPTDTPDRTRLAPDALRWRCDPSELGFETTAHQPNPKAGEPAGSLAYQLT